MTFARRAVVGFAAATALALTWGPAAAHAHAGLEGTSPGASSVLEDAPAEIVLDFDEPVEASLADVQLIFEDGSAVELDSPTSAGDNTQVVTGITAPDDMVQGVYVVVYRVTSADSHGVSGSFSFQLGTASADQSAILAQILAGRSGADTSVAWALWLARIFAYAGTFVLFGAWILVALATGESGAPRRTRAMAWAGLAAAVVGTVGTFVLQAPNALGTGFGGVFDDWSDVAATRYGKSLLARLVLLALAALPTASLSLTRTRQWRLAAAVVGICTLVTFGIGLHPGSGRWPVVGVALDTAHIGGAALWLGGLFVLAVASREWLDGAPLGTPAETIVERFSTLAAVCVAVVVFTGVGQAWRLLDTFDAITATPFGRMLVTKVVVVALLVALGAMARYTLRRHGAASLRKTVFAEAAVGLAVIGLTAGLVARSPDIAHPLAPTVVNLGQGEYRATLTISPARVGANEIHLVVTQPAGATEPTTSATLRLSLPDRGVENLSVALAPDGPDHYSAYGAQLPFAGNWNVEVRVDTSAQDTVLMQGTVQIAGR